MNLGPCRVAVSCCFTTGLVGGAWKRGPSLPCGHSFRKGRKDWLTEPKWCQGAGVGQAGGWQPGWRQLWGSPRLLSGPAPHSTHKSVPMGRSRQHVANVAPRVGLGKLLASAKQPLPLGAEAPWGWGQQGTQSWGLRLSPHRLPGPPRPCTVQTCLKLLPMAFALVSELQLCKSQPFLCPTAMASAPQTVGQHILLCGLCLPFSSFAFRAASPGCRQGAARNKHT